MIDLNKFAEDYVKKQINFYKRDIKPFHRFLITDFAEKLKAELQINNNLPFTTEEQEEDNSKTKVAFITEDQNHITGGRYFAWFVATALVDLGYDVTIYTNGEPVFAEVFAEYPKPKVEIIKCRAVDLANLDIKADIYFGSPIYGDLAASKLGTKYNKPSFAMIYDPHPMMEKYIGARTYPNWSGLLQQLRSSDTKIFSLCKETTKYIYDWLNKREDQVFEVAPCVNSRIRDKVEHEAAKDYVLFISRLVPHKNFDHVLQAVKENNINLKVVTSTDAINAQRMIDDMKLTKQVEICWKVTDQEKFKLIYEAKAVINGATFEGFGMWASEALSCGVPVVCYEYPTLREIAEAANSDAVYFAKWGEKKALGQALKTALNRSQKVEATKAFDYEAMVSQIAAAVQNDIKIGVVMIALNEEQYIAASLKSVIKHKNIAKVAVVEGAVNLFAHAASKDGLSIDNTASEVQKVLMQENGSKVVYDRYGWAADKSELRNRALNLLSKDCNYVLVVDADEVYKLQDLDNLVEAMKQNPNIGVFQLKHLHFWKKKDLIAVGSQWDNRLFRCFKFTDKTFHWDKHELPVINSKGRYIHRTNGAMNLENVQIYHYGYLKDKQRVLDKLEYYKKRDTFLDVDKTIYTNWKMGRETQPTHHGGTVIKFKGEHPEEVLNIL